MPGLVYEDPEAPVKKIVVAMTFTGSGIDLAGACGIGGVIALHPMADEASCGRVMLGNYLSL